MANKKETAGAKGAPASNKATTAKLSNSEAAKRAAEIAEQHGIETVYENPQGEFFTSENLAMLSVGRDKKLLTIHRPALIKGKEPVAETEGGEGTGADPATGEGDTPPAE